jgi:hypothetical protein
MWIFTDIANWWDQNHRQSQQVLDEFVEKNPNQFAIVLATAAHTSMVLGAGLVDVLRIGDGVAQGTVRGATDDGLRLLAFAGPAAKFGRTKLAHEKWLGLSEQHFPKDKWKPGLVKCARDRTSIVSCFLDLLGFLHRIFSSQMGVQARRSREAVGKSTDRRAETCPQTTPQGAPRGRLSLCSSLLCCAAAHAVLPLRHAALASSGRCAQYASSGVWSPRLEWARCALYQLRYCPILALAALTLS